MVTRGEASLRSTIHGSKFPLITKEGTPRLSYQFSQMWEEGKK